MTGDRWLEFCAVSCIGTVTSAPYNAGINEERTPMDSNDKTPLSGIVVLELSHTVMGPACGMILADMGAEVYKVERTGKGDETRHLKGFGAGFFTCFNRNKKSVSLDLKSERGREILMKLVETADVLIENFGPGTADRLGVGYEDCRRVNPRLVYCSLKGFMPGPYEKRPALDEVVQMMGGLAYMTGPSGRPLRAGASVTDILGGTFGAVGILSALYERETTGRGRLVTATLFESVAFLVSQHMGVAALTGVAPPPMPERGRTWSVYDLFETADGEQVFVGVTSDRHWKRMCETFGFTDWAEDSALATNQGRIEAREWFLPALSARLLRMTKPELMETAEKAGIPFAPVSRPQDLFEDPHLNASNSLVEIPLPDGKTAKLPKIPLQLNRSGFPLKTPPPAIGEGSYALYRRIGMTDDEIIEAAEAGVIHPDPTEA